MSRVTELHYRRGLAFRRGWDDGYQARATGGEREWSPRQGLKRYPWFDDDELTAYLNGRHDGYDDDRYRLGQWAEEEA